MFEIAARDRLLSSARAQRTILAFEIVRDQLSEIKTKAQQEVAREEETKPVGQEKNSLREARARLRQAEWEWKNWTWAWFQSQFGELRG